ncbi:prepilin-type N-terminal cleavage/methylation domain-containing protein [bacterium]|jgi:prepilin-type N-terminal cleavage/methylation domain-containing protein|nr:prepilin-type N-terminal cleavage/methylation domain-containing protein [bacterium]MBT6293361.1 prepilin-type N-terminal cleavage/methylation domain-containing protein [bacterium]
MQKKGFTLIEVLISASIFSVIFLIGTQSYISAVKQSFFSTSNQVFDNQIQIFINRLDNLIEGNTINLNEYFVQCHMAGDCPFYGDILNPEDNTMNFGENEGLYYHQFFDLGTNTDGGQDGYSYDCTDRDCILGIIESSKDVFQGSFGGEDGTNAICNSDEVGFRIQEKSIVAFVDRLSTANCENKEMEFSVLFLKSKTDQDQLIIGNSGGNLVYQKLKNKNNEFLANGLPTYFASYDEEVNYQTLAGSENHLNFKNLKIVNFKVKIAPLENPEFAIAENNNDNLRAPKLEVSFTISQKESSSLFKLFDKEVKIHKIYNL